MENEKERGEIRKGRLASGRSIARTKGALTKVRERKRYVNKTKERE